MGCGPSCAKSPPRLGFRDRNQAPSLARIYRCSRSHPRQTTRPYCRNIEIVSSDYRDSHVPIASSSSFFTSCLTQIWKLQRAEMHELNASRLAGGVVSLVLRTCKLPHCFRSAAYLSHSFFAVSHSPASRLQSRPFKPLSFFVGALAHKPSNRASRTKRRKVPRDATTQQAHGHHLCGLLARTPHSTQVSHLFLSPWSTRKRRCRLNRHKSRPLYVAITLGPLPRHR